MKLFRSHIDICENDRSLAEVHGILAVLKLPPDAPTEAVRSLKWRAVDCPNSSWKSIAAPENLFANAAWNRRLTEYRVPWKNLFDSTQTFRIRSTMIEQDYFFYEKRKKKRKEKNLTVKQDFIGKLYIFKLIFQVRKRIINFNYI